MKKLLSLGICFIICITILNFSCRQVNPEARNKPLVDQYLAAWNTGNVDLLDKVAAAGFELRMTPRYQPVKGLDSLKYEIKYWRTAYPDFHIRIDEIVFASNAVTVRWTITGTNSGPGSMPPTGKTVDVPGMSLLHIQNGKITDEWIASNNLLWLKQLGLEIVPPTQAGQ